MERHHKLKRDHFISEDILVSKIYKILHDGEGHCAVDCDHLNYLPASDVGYCVCFGKRLMLDEGRGWLRCDDCKVSERL